MPDPIDEFVLLVKDRLLTIYGETQKARGIVALLKLIPVVLRTIEEIAVSGHGMTGEQKKAAAVDIINDLIDIPFFPEWVEARIIALLIDALIAGFNILFGHLWLTKAQPMTP